MKHRFNKDWADKKMSGTGKDAREISRQEYRAGVAYKLEPDVLARATEDGVIGDDGPAGRAAQLSLPAEDILKMNKEPLQDFVLNGGTVDTSREEAALTERDEAKAELETVKVARDAVDAEVAALIAAWNKGQPETDQVKSLGDISAVVVRMNTSEAALMKAGAA